MIGPIEFFRNNYGETDIERMEKEFNKKFAPRKFRHYLKSYYGERKENYPDDARGLKRLIDLLTSHDGRDNIPTLKTSKTGLSQERRPAHSIRSNGVVGSFSINEGAEVIRNKASHIHKEIDYIINSVLQMTNTKTPVNPLKALFKEAGWSMEWKITDNIDNRVDAYKERIAVELEFSNRDQCHRDFNRFLAAFKKNKIDAAVLITFADINAVARWKRDKSMKDKGSIQYLTLDWLRATVDEYSPIIGDVPIWFLGIL
jgi:Restriction endonuclease BglII